MDIPGEGSVDSGGSVEEPPKALLLALFAAIFAAAAGTHALTPIFPELKSELEVGDGGVRLLTSVFTFGYAVSGIILGVLCDRIGRRKILLPSLVVLSLSSALLGFSPSTLGYAGVLGFRLAAGLATGGVVAAVLALVSDSVPYAKRGRAMAFVLSGSFVAVVVGIPVASLLARHHLTLFFILIAALSVLCLLALFRLAPRDTCVGYPSSSSRLLALALAQPSAKAVLFATFFNTLAAFAVVTSVADYCVDRFQSEMNSRTLIFLFMGLSALPGAFVAGLISDRLGKRRTVIIALVLSLASLPWLIMPTTFTMFVVAVCVVSLVQAARQGPFAAILTEVAGDHLRGSIIGWNSLASGLGLASGAWFSGLAYSSLGFKGALFLAVCALVISLLVFSLWVRVRPTPSAGDAEVP